MEANRKIMQSIETIEPKFESKTFDNEKLWTDDRLLEVVRSASTHRPQLRLITTTSLIAIVIFEFFLTSQSIKAYSLRSTFYGPPCNLINC